jgi:hypothetical protein
MYVSRVKNPSSFVCKLKSSAEKQRGIIYSSLNHFFSLTLVAEPSMQTIEWRNEEKPGNWVRHLPAPSTPSLQF